MLWLTCALSTPTILWPLLGCVLAKKRHAVLPFLLAEIRMWWLKVKHTSGTMTKRPHMEEDGAKDRHGLILPALDC